MTTTNVTTDEDGLFETAMSSDYDYDHPYTETACEWHRRHVLTRARRLAGIETSCSCSSSSTSSDSSFTDEILGGAEEEDGTELGNHHDNDIDFAGDFGGGGGGVNNNDESRRRKAIKSGRRPLYRWMTTYPLVAARCCLSLDPSSSSTGTITARTTASAARSNSYNTATTPREDEAMRLRRVLRRLHHRKQHSLSYPKKILKYSNKNGEEYDVVATSSSPVFHHPPPHSSSSLTSSSVTMSLEQQLLRIKQESIDTESNRMVIQSFLPRGTGISFIDAALLLKCETKEDQHHTTASRYSTTTSRLVLELNGPPRCGMTSILLAVAARYVACTSKLMLFDNNIIGCAANSSGSRRQDRIHNDKKSTATTRGLKGSGGENDIIEPRVVILDLEHGVHAVKLALSVREAVLRRWEETALARQWHREQEKLWTMESADEETVGGGRRSITTDDNIDEEVNEFNTTMIEQRQIELAIASCLGRINIVQPRDVTYLSLLATLEDLRHSLEEEREAARADIMTDDTSTNPRVEPPTLILIDSLTSLDASTRYLESLPTNIADFSISSGSSSSKRSSSGGGSGLSDRNEFYRQLIRLRDENEVAIFGTSRCSPSSLSSRMNNGRSSDQTSRVGGKRGSSSSLWEKMVSHRISLHHVAEGSQEYQSGYDFVATVKTNGRQEDTTSVFPYSITAGGIAC